MPGDRLYSAHAAEVDYDPVRQFVLASVTAQA